MAWVTCPHCGFTQIPAARCLKCKKALDRLREGEPAAAPGAASRGQPRRRSGMAGTRRDTSRVSSGLRRARARHHHRRSRLGLAHGGHHGSRPSSRVHDSRAVEPGFDGPLAGQDRDDDPGHALPARAPGAVRRDRSRGQRRRRRSDADRPRTGRSGRRLPHGSRRRAPRPRARRGPRPLRRPAPRSRSTSSPMRPGCPGATAPGAPSRGSGATPRRRPISSSNPGSRTT